MSINIYSPKPSKILFIDESYVKQSTELDENVDPKMIRTTIQYMQDRYALPVLGNNLFELWKQNIYSGITIQNNPSYYFLPQDLFLLETWIQPMLCASVMIELVYKISLQLRNKGVQQSHSEFSTVATDKQIEWLSENYRETANFYAQRAIQYLNANPDIYLNWLNPQLNSSGNGADLYYPENTKYNSSIYIPGVNNNSTLASGGVGYGMSVNQRIEAFGFFGVD